jgi:hypothetical protein
VNKLFICGCGHSGTSLLQAIMLAHSQCIGIREESELFLHNNESKAIPYMQAIEASDPAKLYIVEKTPRHVRRIDDIIEIFPESTFIICYRNPLDVVGSLVKRGFSLNDAIVRFNTDNIAWLSNRHRTSFLEIKYEYFVANISECLHNVCNRLGIEFESTMLDYWKLSETYYNIDKSRYDNYVTENMNKNIEEFKRDEGENHLFLRNFQLKQPICDMSGSWKLRLSASEVKEVITRTNDVARLLGYDLFNIQATYLSDNTI